MSPEPQPSGWSQRVPPIWRAASILVVGFCVLAVLWVVLDIGWRDAARGGAWLAIGMVVALVWMRSRLAAALLGAVVFSLLGVLLYDLDAKGAVVRGIVVGAAGAAALLYLDRAERRRGARRPE